MEVISNIWWFIISLGILISFHEFGHFWVARRNGVHVQRFSIGFGPALWSRMDSRGTEYRIALIPLGGYVKMLDSRVEDISPAEQGGDFSSKTVWQRIAIVLAGPLANIVLAVALLFLMFTFGRPDFDPRVGKSSAIAAEAGIKSGDLILSVDSRATPTWTDAGIVLGAAAMDRRDAQVRLQSVDESTRSVTLMLSDPDFRFEEKAILRDIGLIPQQSRLPMVVGVVDENSPAFGVLREGDEILRVEGRPAAYRDEIAPLLAELGPDQRALRIEWRRDGSLRSADIVPMAVESGAQSRYLLGFSVAPYRPQPDALLRYSPLAAVPAALAETYKMTGDIVGMFARMIKRSASLDNMLGPLSIAETAGATAQLGPGWYLFFLAMLSLSLAILNLLPVPILDGGHLLYYLIELMRGRPVSERTMMIGQYVGLLFLFTLMSLAIFNDLT